jgi:hypothetical protein
MKALSIRQPWAWLAVNGHMDVDNRDWKPRTLPGKILIHASRFSMTTAQYDAFELFMFKIHQPIPRIDTMRFGGIVGEVEVIGITEEPNYPSRWRNHKHGKYGWILANAKPLDFFACSGKLGLFDVNYLPLLTNPHRVQPLTAKAENTAG